MKLFSSIILLLTALTFLLVHTVDGLKVDSSARKTVRRQVHEAMDNLKISSYNKRPQKQARSKSGRYSMMANNNNADNEKNEPSVAEKVKVRNVVFTRKAIRNSLKGLGTTQSTLRRASNLGAAAR